MMRHNSNCVGCGDPADMYLMFYDHRDCLLIRSELLLVPVCDEDAHAVNQTVTLDHHQCMGRVVEAEAVAVALFDKEVTIE